MSKKNSVLRQGSVLNCIFGGNADPTSEEHVLTKLKPVLSWPEITEDFKDYLNRVLIKHDEMILCDRFYQDKCTTLNKVIRLIFRYLI